MTFIPAVVTIPDLPTGTTLTGAELLEAVQTAAGVGQSIQVAVSQVAGAILPSGGSTGQYLQKSGATTQWGNIASNVLASTGLAQAGSTTVSLSLASTAGLSVLGVGGTGSAVPAAITGTADQVMIVNHAGNVAQFGAVNLATSAAVTGSLSGSNLTTNLIFPGFVKYGPTLPQVPSQASGELYYDSTGAYAENDAAVNIIVDLGSTAPPGLISNLWITNFSQGSTTPTFLGGCALRLEASDRTTVTSGNKGVLYGMLVDINPIVVRNNSPNDDATGIVIQNIGAVRGADAFFIGQGSGTTSAQWSNAIAIGCSATTMLLSNGTFTNGIDLTLASMSGSAYKSPGYSINSTGGMITGSSSLSNGAITFNGSTSGSVLVNVNATASVYNVNALVSAFGGAVSIFNGTQIGNSVAPTVGGTTSFGYTMSNVSNLGIFCGSGSPTITAGTGSLYINNAGTTASTLLWINTNGSNTWTAVLAP